MEFAFLLIFSIVFLAIQAYGSNTGRMWASVIGGFIVVMLTLGIFAGVAIESDSMAGLVLFDIIFLALMFWGIYKVNGGVFFIPKKKTPVQRAMQKIADHDFEAFDAIKRLHWGTPINSANFKQFKKEFPEAESMPLEQAKFHFYEWNARRIYRSIYGKEYTGSLWGPAIIGPDGNPIDQEKPEPTKEEQSAPDKKE